jgi:menaquinone-dependent protoporphyrinogen oxidase
MTTRILVAYASGTGSTGEVAEAIAEVLRQSGAEVDVRAVQGVQDVASYGAIVLGSSIRIGRWLPGAVAFLEDFHPQMARIPVAYFTTCLTMAEDTEDSRRTVLGYLEPVLALAPQIKPVGLGLFAGSLDPQQRLIMPFASGPHGDYRDWDKIRAWAREILPDLLGQGTLPDDHTVLVTSLQRDVDRARVELPGAKLPKADLTGADLRGAVLRDARLHWADLCGSDLRGADLAGSNLMGADLREAQLQDANLRRAILNGAQFRMANLSRADLRFTDLNWANLSGANLSGADLSRANLGWANLTGANLDLAILEGSRYNDQTQWPEGFSPEESGCVFVGHLG